MVQIQQLESGMVNLEQHMVEAQEQFEQEKSRIIQETVSLCCVHIQITLNALHFLSI